MTRIKSVLKILSAVFAVLLLALFFAGCGEYKPPENNSGGGTVDPGGDPKPTPPETEDNYTVTLYLREDNQQTPFTSEIYPLVARLQAQWTEITDGRPEVYRAPFDKNGVAKIGALDGDFNVTLIVTDNFRKSFTYDPNPARPERKDELVATKYKKDVSVSIYQLRPIGESQSILISTGSSYTRESGLSLEGRGAYKFTFNSMSDSQLFFFKTPLQGEYSFFTLIDVTQDEVNPVLKMYNGNLTSGLFYPADETENLGGAEGNYTKNIWLKYALDEAQAAGGGVCMAFRLSAESEKSDAYPLTVCFIFERDGEYTRPIVDVYDVPVTEDFTKVPARPSGDIRFISDYDPSLNVNNAQHILNQKNVKYNDPKNGGDGYYYYLNAATGDFYREEDGSVSAQYRVYAVITQTIPVLVGMGQNGANASLTYPDLTKSYAWLVGEDGTTKNYYNFIMGRNGYASHCNVDGAYPVNAELKQFLQDFAISQRYFNDGIGHAEAMGVNSDEDSQWLFACGVYVI